MNKVQNVINAFSALVQDVKKAFKSSKKSPGVKQDPDQHYIDMVKKNEDIGIRFDFFTWNLIVRPLVSVVSGLVATMVLLVIDSIIGSDLIDFWLGAGLVLLIAYLVGMGEKEMEVVPEGGMAMVTWFGTQFRIYRLTGEYRWTGKNFRLGRTMSVKEPMTDKKGFFFTDVVQVNIWDVYQADASKRSNVLNALTKTGGEIRANLLIMITMRDPMLWITKTDPMMDIGERSRMSFRTAVSFFTGKDVVSVKNLLTELMSGYVVLTCFLKKGVDTLAKHSLIRNSGGDPMYESVRPGEDIDKERAKFIKAVMANADQEMKVELHYNQEPGKENEPLVDTREISESLEAVLHACGVTLTRASVGFIGLPEEVVKAANQADAQPYQLKTQRASAQAAKIARDLLRPEEEDRNDPTFADRQAYAAASDPDSNVQVIHVSGGSAGSDPLGIKAAAAIQVAAANNGNKGPEAKKPKANPKANEASDASKATKGS
jgi:hypothetical protein